MMKRLLITSVLGFSLAGCASFEKWQNFENEQVEEKIAQTESFEQEMAVETMEPESDHVSFQNRYREKLFSSRSASYMHSAKQEQQDINYYVRGMMQDLVGNLQYVSSKTPMAVSSFVFLDGSYEYSDIVGKQISESFLHEVHKFGIPVVDFKSTDYIRVTQNGDFVLSKDFLDLDGDLPVKYVLTGTLVKQPSGYLVNARIIGMKSKAVVGTAQGKLPIHVINSLISSDENTGVLLMSDNQDM
jgi:TolB-like protein